MVKERGECLRSAVFRDAARHGITEPRKFVFLRNQSFSPDVFSQGEKEREREVGGKTNISLVEDTEWAFGLKRINSKKEEENEQKKREPG